MPEYTLIYFNARGLAELTRWLLAYADITYKDERIEEADWPAKKSTIIGGKVPVLMVDGKPLPQSLAIARYVAKEAGLVPQDNLKAAFCDAAADTLAEMMGEVYKVLFSSKTEEEKKQQIKEEVYPNVVEPILTRLQKRLSEKEWFAGDTLTWTDLHLSVVFGEMQKRRPEFLTPFPAVDALVQKVRALPKIKEWIEKAPDTKF